MYTPPRSKWPPFLALVGWVVIPFCLAVSIADRRNESVVIAAVLAIVLGWIGFVLVYAFMGRDRRHDVAAKLNL